MSALFEHEEIRLGNGFPSLIRFFKGDPSKPLVVFFPGWSHLGRISYGFPSCDERHFLAYWLVRKGYSFLATSYPIDHPVYLDVYPEFNLTDWGEMAADIVDQIITENNLIKEIIAINWSASGQVVRPFNVSCIKRGIDMRFDMVVEATPGIQVPFDRIEGLKKTDKNMISTESSLYSLFWKELQEQSLKNTVEIMSRKQYTDNFLGDIPVAITGTDEFFENKGFTEDKVKGLDDKGFFSFNEYPLIAIISGDSVLAPYHPIVDKYTWGFLLTRKIYHDYFVKSQKLGYGTSEQKIKELIPYINTISDRLSKVVSGNHFLFVGKKGARSVANHLEKFDSEIEKIKSDISGMLS